MTTPLVLYDHPRSNVAGHGTRLGTGILWLPIAGLIAWLGTGSVVESSSVTLAWDPPAGNVDGTPVTDLAGYRVYCGTASRVYSTVIEVGDVTTATVTNLAAGVACYFAVTCSNKAGHESDFSEELVWTPPAATDSDGDGISDRAELKAGTSPYDPNSVLKMSSPRRPTGVGETGIAVEWACVIGKYYTVERSTNLLAVPAFTSIASNVPGQTSITAYTDTTATGIGPYYYRVQVEP